MVREAVTLEEVVQRWKDFFVHIFLGTEEYISTHGILPGSVRRRCFENKRQSLALLFRIFFHDDSEQAADEVLSRLGSIRDGVSTKCIKLKYTSRKGPHPIFESNNVIETFIGLTHSNHMFRRGGIR